MRPAIVSRRNRYWGRAGQLLGTLRSENGDDHGNVAEKYTSDSFTFFRDYSWGPS